MESKGGGKFPPLKYFPYGIRFYIMEKNCNSRNRLSTYLLPSPSGLSLEDGGSMLRRNICMYSLTSPHCNPEDERFRHEELILWI